MSDTICAISTPPGYGGIGIVRVSGQKTQSIATAILGKCPQARQATFSEFVDAHGEAIDVGIALFFPRPGSFTGEDVLELHGHGGMVVQEMICERVQELGARLANPGEFSERAFLNDRMDLAQAEAVADLINAATVQAARASTRSLSGRFSNEVRAIDRAVLELRMYVESAIDFADEEIDFLADGEVERRANSLMQRLDALIRRTQQGRVMSRGTRIAIAGAPNVGKSSLLNALLNEDRAIVTDIAGTTRDTLDATIAIDGMLVEFVDTAGLRESDEPIELAGMQRTRDALETSDGVLWIVDDRTGDELPEISGPAILARNKCDLSGRSAGVVANGVVRICALHGWGLDELRAEIKNLAGFESGDDAFAGRPRHIRALQSCHQCVVTAVEGLHHGNGELVAEDMRLAHQALGSIVGETTTDDLLGEIFSAFCIGK